MLTWLNLVALCHTVKMSDGQKITRKRPIRYPRQVITMASDEIADAIEATAAEEDVSKSVVARRWLERGRVAEDEARVELRSSLGERAPMYGGSDEDGI